MSCPLPLERDLSRGTARARGGARLASWRFASTSRRTMGRSARTAGPGCRGARRPGARRLSASRTTSIASPTSPPGAPPAPGRRSGSERTRSGSTTSSGSSRRERPCPQPIQAHALHDRREPRPDVVTSVVPALLARSQASWTHVLRFGQGAEHPVCRPAHARAVLLESGRQVFGHVAPHRSVKGMTYLTARDVTRLRPLMDLDDDTNPCHSRTPEPRSLAGSNPVTRRLLRAGLPMGPNTLLTVRGRTSGVPRSAPVAIVAVDGRRYVIGAYRDVQRVRNLRAAGTAVVRLDGREVGHVGPEAARRGCGDLLRVTLRG